MSENKEKLSSIELAEERTRLAKLRNDLAENRTLQAAERTYAAWIRTGFSIAGAGWTLSQLLRDSENYRIALLIGGTLIVLGLMCFVYAWLGYKSVYDYIKESFLDNDMKNYPFTMNLLPVSVLSVVLFIVFVAGFGMLLF